MNRYGSTHSIPRGASRPLSATERSALDRVPPSDDMVRTTSEAIIDVVRREGDAALVALAREYDKVRLKSFEVPREDVARGAAGTRAPVRAAMERAAANIRAVHAAMVPQRRRNVPEPGVTVGRRPDPLQRVGVYAPGGRAAYPSSVLWASSRRASQASARSFICAPPGANGLPAACTLAAAELSGAIECLRWVVRGDCGDGLRHGDDSSRRPHRRPR